MAYSSPSQTPEFRRQRYKDDPEYRRKRLEANKRSREKRGHLWVRGYSIGQKDYESRLKEQDYKCAICGITATPDKRFHLDHNHKTDEKRKLLCHHCNVGLGMFKENPEILISAVGYLESY